MIQQRIQNPLAVEMLKQRLPEGSRVKVDFADEQFSFERIARKRRLRNNRCQARPGDQECHPERATAAASQNETNSDEANSLLGFTRVFRLTLLIELQAGDDDFAAGGQGTDLVGDHRFL